jgi:GntR family transcriptional regulator, transcriptional repressor for pyruvate dehydrogenase complex
MEEMIRQNTIVEQVLQRVKELIADGTFAVGEKIPTEVELTKMFGVGRSSVREAIKILQYLGIVKMLPSKGTFVCDCSNLSKEVVTWSILLGKKGFFELIGLRKAIEMASVRDLLSTKSSDPEVWKTQVSKLQSSYDLMVTTSSIDVFVQEDYNFHETIIQGSGNSIYLDIYHTLRAFMHEEIKRAFMAATENRVEQIHEEHAAILASIIERRLDDAQEQLKKHIENVENRIELSFQNNFTL